MTTPTKPVSKRGAARLAAVQALYQIDFTGSDPELTIAEFLEHRLGREIDGEKYREADADWFAQLVRGVIAGRDDLDAEILPLLEKDRSIARLQPILRAALRGGVYELLRRTDVEARTIITEYVEVARAFFDTGPEPGMVNGILDRLAHRLRAAEFAGRER